MISRILLLLLFVWGSTLASDVIINIFADEGAFDPQPVSTGFHARRFLRRHSLTNHMHNYNNLLGDTNNDNERWFSQYLDHSNPKDARQWKQRYFVNTTFYRPGGPAFLMIGGEGEASPIWMSHGTWMEYARVFGAICFQLEHRFYGKSHPTEDMSVENLSFLSSEQALQDLAYFITGMNGEHNLTEARWIAFGGSYPGSLAAWFRLKFPHLVHGAVSTSGPLLAKADFFEYLEVVSDAFDVTDSGCNPAVRQAMEEAKKMVEDKSKWAALTEELKLCTPFSADHVFDAYQLMETLIGNYEDVVQYNKDNRDFEGAKNTNITVKVLCDMMVDPTEKDNFRKMARVNELMLKVNGEKCLDYRYDSMIGDLRNISWGSPAGVGGRQWTYQTCTEFGWYQSSDQVGHPYTDYFPASFFEQMCSDIFGPEFNLELLNRAIERTNINYGAKNIVVTNVVFVHGSIDPWHAMGVTQDLSDLATAIYIQGTAHCANMYPESPRDPPQLKMARKKVMKKIDQWLRQN